MPDLPCPLCGGLNLARTKDKIDHLLGNEGDVYCKDCLCKAPIPSWNGRKSGASQDSQGEDSQ